MNKESIPYEVQVVRCFQWTGEPVGMKTYNMIQEIIDKYPEYFKWEHAYKKIPQEVHDAFNKECYPPIDFSKIECTGMSIFEQIQTASPIAQGMTFKSVMEMMDKWQEQEETERVERLKESNRVRKIWDKHYKKYGLECREIACRNNYF